MQNKPHHTHEVLQPPPVEPAPRTPPPAPRPLPAAAEFVAECAAAASLEASLERIAQPRNLPTEPAVPGLTGLSSPAVRLSNFAGLTVAANSSPAHAIGRGDFPFAGEPPRVPGSAIGPLWITPERQAPKERPHAGFAPMGPRWAAREPGEFRASTVIRSTIAPCLRDAPLAPCSPAVAPAVAVRCSVEMNRQLAAPVVSAGTTWHRAWKPTFEPRAPVALLKSGISCSNEMAAARAALATRSSGCGPISRRPVHGGSEPGISLGRESRRETPLAGPCRVCDDRTAPRCPGGKVHGRRDRASRLEVSGPIRTLHPSGCDTSEFRSAVTRRTKRRGSDSPPGADRPRPLDDPAGPRERCDAGLEPEAGGSGAACGNGVGGRWPLASFPGGAQLCRLNSGRASASAPPSRFKTISAPGSASGRVGRTGPRAGRMTEPVSRVPAGWRCFPVHCR